jgi:hypothetical protein
MLVDKCSGQTWILAKTNQRGRGMPYRWSRVPIDHPEIAKVPQPSAVAPAATGEKCFTFQGRQFCE